MSKRYFEGLTEKQFYTLSRIACGDDTGITPRIVKTLVAKGLVTPYKQSFETKIGVLEVDRYEVPLRVHIAWAQWCGANVTDEEMAEEDKGLE